jgi:exonuclease III
MDPLIRQFNIMSWNVWGLNNTARQEDVRQIVTSVKPNIICLQETKLSTISIHDISNILGNDYEDSFCFLPANGTRGGVLIASRASVCSLHQSQISENTISATVTDPRCNFSWTISRVYGPQGELEKNMFIRELKRLKQSVMSHWLLIGDFNLIYRDQDKNNGRLNRRLMLRF